jgi:predicted TIM-barrel fold metal-dependent hydrolase
MVDRSNLLISVDDHVQERPDVWSSRLSQSKWGDRLPRLERQADGTQRWVVDGHVLAVPGAGVAGAVMGDRAREPQVWDEVPRVAYDPRERLRAVDADGVDYSVLYPTVGGGGETFGRITDPELELACVQAYNDWLLEEWASASERFVPQCLVPLFPANAAVAEIRRAVANGHRGVIYPANPMELRDVPHVNEPDYDPIWATCEELGVPLCIHAGSSSAIQAPVPAGFSPTVAAAFASITRQASTTSVLVHLLISRILMRHPNLKVVFAESSLGWGAYQLEMADQQFREDGLLNEGYELTPSQLFRRQCYLTGWYGQAGIRTRDIIGTENIMWSTNFPSASSSWPTTHAFVERAFAGVPDDERAQILWKNAATLYRLEI